MADDKSLESDDGAAAVVSTENMSLFDEEILNSDDPNNTYFNYLVGMEDAADETLSGDSTLDSQTKEYQVPLQVQKLWMKMADNVSLVPGGDDDTDTLDHRSLPRIPEGVFDNINIDKDFKTVSLPPVMVYVGKEVDRTIGTLEQAPDGTSVCAPATSRVNQPTNQPEQAPITSSRDYEKSCFGRNKRVMIAVLIFFFLTTVGLAVALVMFIQHPSPSSPSTSISTGAQRGDTGRTDDDLSIIAPSSPPTASPEENIQVEDQNTTRSPVVAATTSEPTMSPTTVSPTASPTAPPTMAPTGPLTAMPTNLPTLAPTDSLPFVLDELISLLASVSSDGGAALSNRSTPQFFAAQWLSRESGYTWYSDQTKIQRYALATLYLSTSGYQWLNSTGWLTQQDECDWFTAVDDSACNFNGEIDRFYLPANNLKGTLPPEIALLSNSLGTCKFCE